MSTLEVVNNREARQRCHIALCGEWIDYHKRQRETSKRTAARSVTYHDAEIRRYEDLLAWTQELRPPNG